MQAQWIPWISILSKLICWPPEPRIPKFPFGIWTNFQLQWLLVPRLNLWKMSDASLGTNKSNISWLQQVNIFLLFTFNYFKNDLCSKMANFSSSGRKEGVISILPIFSPFKIFWYDELAIEVWSRYLQQLQNSRLGKQDLF